MNNDTKEHLLKFLSNGKRFDGRGLTDLREIKIEVGVSSFAEGSCQVTMGDTIVMAGVKLSIEKPYPDTPDDGMLMFNAEFMPMSSPEFEAGPPGQEAIELARVVDKNFRESHAIDTKKLCIKPGEKAWSVGVDICTINSAGNLLDASALASLVALKNTHYVEYKNDKLDYSKKTDQKLELHHEPIQITVLKIGNYFIVDPTSEEEKAADARLTLGFEKDGTICEVQKGGSMPLAPDEIMKMVDIAFEKSKDIRKLL